MGGLLSGLGIGGSSARSRSSSQSDSISASFDNLDAFGFGVSTDTSRSGGSSVSGSRDVSSSRVAFEDIFAQLFGNASATAAGIDTGAITGAANLLFGSGRSFLDTLQSSPELEGQFAAADADEAASIDLLEADIGEFLRETVNPAITQRGVTANTLGGSRGEVQRGIASEAALEEFVRGATGIRRDTQARKDSLAGQLATDRLARSQTGINALPELFGLAESGAFASLSPLAALAQILGPQTVLTDASGVSFGESSQFGESAGSSLQFDTTTGRAGSAAKSTSSSQSSSKSKSFSLGF